VLAGLITCFLGFLISPALGVGFSLIFVYYLFSGGKNKASDNQFQKQARTKYSQTETRSWPVIFETQLDQSAVSFLQSRLDAENIPYVIENDNLFNSGMNIEFGVHVPLQIRVPEEDEQAARTIVEEMMTEKRKSTPE